MANPAPAETAPEPVQEPVRSIRQTAADYMIPLSQDAADAWKGREKEYGDYAKEVAKGMYPTFAPQLDAGIRTATLLDPYTQVAKNVLGADATPQWDDPKWNAALQGARTKDGAPAPMTLNDWHDHLTQTREFGYEFTPRARANAQQVVAELRRQMSHRA